jgi:quercetin dioxygenase-like cupin family protein
MVRNKRHESSEPPIIIRLAFFLTLDFTAANSAYSLDGDSMFVTDTQNVKEYVVRKQGARGVTVKYLLHKGVGAEKLQLRLFKIAVGGLTPLEKHDHEQEVYILKGTVSVRGGKKEAAVTAGNVIFIQSNEEHQFKNVGNELVEFLCTKETPQP